jgi:short-subunit dehydrogenase
MMTERNAATEAGPPHRTILITGASSGIGRALALACAAPGTKLYLSGRDQRRLQQVARECRDRGATVDCQTIDVCDADAMARWIAQAGRLDLVIAKAGIGAGSDDGRPEPAHQVRALFATNLDGALNTALPALAIMMAQDPGPDGVRGRIATIASLAGFIPGPSAAAYGASKAALDRWTVATAHHAATHGVVMTSVCPGFIRTPMTAGNRFSMPGLMDADRAAAIILRGVLAGRRRISFPWWMAGLARLVGALPPRWATALLAGSPGKAPLKPGQ